MKELYIELYEAYISKNEIKLNELLDDSFQIIHVNGMIQTKQEFIQSLVKGMNTYESFDIKNINESIMDDKAIVLAENKVMANLYMTGNRIWNLKEKVALIKKEKWCIYRILVTI